MKFYVYELIELPSGRVLYVGKGTAKRMYVHKKNVLRYNSNQTGFYRRLQALLDEGKDFEPRKVFETDDQEEALSEEQRRIAEYGLKNLFNSLPAQRGPTGWNEQVRAAMRRSRLEAVAKCKAETGHGLPKDHREAIGRAHKGLKRSPAMKVNMRSARVRNKAARKPAASGYFGVSWQNKGKRWVSRLTHDTVSIYLGVFRSKEDAARIYDDEHEHLYGTRPNKT